MKNLISIMLILLSLFVCFGQVLAEVHYQETITPRATHRITISTEGTGGILYEENLPGNSEFNLPRQTFSFSHSVRDISPPLLPQGVIATARLKLFLRNDQEEDLEIIVDSLTADGRTRRLFLQGPESESYIEVSQALTDDGLLRVVGRTDYRLFKSVFDLRYVAGPPQPLSRAKVDLIPVSAHELAESELFNSETSIVFTLPQASVVDLAVYNIEGEKVTTLVRKIMSAGRHVARWNGLNHLGHSMDRGQYFYRLRAGKFIDTQKVLILR